MENVLTKKVLVVVVAVCLGAIGSAPADFPGQGDDVVSCMAMFRILVDDPHRPLMAGYPGYDVTSSILTSPVLFDENTVIGRSGPHQDGDASDTGGTPVGTAQTIISDGDISMVPPSFEGPAGTREVHTEVRHLSITDPLGSGMAVRAGTGLGLTLSPGEVESMSGASGDPDLDFPAESFFDVFVEVDLPGLGGLPIGTLFNDDPLLVEIDNLSGFPPPACIQANTNAVPVYFRDDNPGLWNAGDRFGWIVLLPVLPANQPPVADAGSDLTVEQTSYAGAEVTLDGSGSTDDGQLLPLTYAWAWDGCAATGETATVTLPLGTTTVTLTVDDGMFTDTDTVDIAVVDTTPPELTIPEDVTVEQESHEGTVVPLEATATDICDPNPVITSNELDIYPPGVTVVTFTATDASGNSTSRSMTVTVVDTTPPTISDISANPDELWPPNHKMVEVTVSVDVEDICDPVPFCYILGVSSNEPINGPGDGDTEPDWEYTNDPLVVLLRAERAGDGDGRVYTIDVVCEDASGNIKTGTVNVIVPHDQGKGKK